MQRSVIMRVGFTRQILRTAQFSTATKTEPIPEGITSSKAEPPAGDAKRLRLVVAVGGNALQRRGERLTIENMLKAAADMAPTMVDLAKKHQLGMD